MAYLSCAICVGGRRSGRDLSPKNRTMISMRFPDNVTQWRFQHEEEALQRRADH